MYSFVNKCKELLNEVTDEIKGDDRYYTLRKICLAQYTGEDEKLILPIGRQNDGEYVYMNFEEVASLFISGTTGTGKSVFLDSLIVTLMLKNSHDEVKLFFFDPKKVELGEYNGIDYLYCKDSLFSLKESKKALLKVLNTMEERSNKLIETHHRSIKTYNKNTASKWAHFFIFIDEACNLLKSEEIKEMLIKIADYGKPLGIHLILATNAYLEDLNKDGFIKHFKYRMSFDLASKEQADFIHINGSNLLNTGESLINDKHGHTYQFFTPYISTPEIARVVLEVGRKK